ncbi:hypothetical protein Y032_0010g1222 [Ancylostoma ceylanicum]|uniref:GPR180/TMEM145 transmembrane domain-containing protein n=2 Tax=Ancylostoma ceylanicum TaxID=53326 RepID=A0A016VGQ2_9BILA|nr:hypothetical protein Y032_0010g1222 [Ancylostoma ceylanicum]
MRMPVIAFSPTGIPSFPANFHPASSCVFENVGEMVRKWVALKIIISFLLTAFADAVHVTGKWNTGYERVKVITKFGFQQTSALDRENTRGFVFGNVTSRSLDNSSRPFLFALVPQTLIGSFHSDSKYAMSCGLMMQNISKLGFESRCFANGKRGDIFRWIPCTEGQLCREEDDPRVVVPGFQMTMQIEEPSTAEYWYIVLLACHLDKACQWVHSNISVVAEYDIWLTNGRPGSSAASPLTWQFSFDEQDTLEIYMVTLVGYIVLSAIMSRGLQLTKRNTPPARLRASFAALQKPESCLFTENYTAEKENGFETSTTDVSHPSCDPPPSSQSLHFSLLSFLITIKTVGVALQTLNVFVFAVDGRGLFFARVLGEFLRIAGIELLWLLLLLLSRGWGLYPWASVPSRSCIILWAILASAHFILFICNFVEESISQCSKILKVGGVLLGQGVPKRPNKVLVGECKIGRGYRV